MNNHPDLPTPEDNYADFMSCVRPGANPNPGTLGIVTLDSRGEPARYTMQGLLNHERNTQLGDPSDSFSANHGQSHAAEATF